MLAIAGAAAAVTGQSESSGLGGALVDLLIGVAIGVAVGFAGGWLLGWARLGGWAAEDFIGVAVLALALLAYLAALAVSGNGFVAAFCGGIAFGAAAGHVVLPNSPSSSRQRARSPCSCGWRSARSPSTA
jgi:sodium/hydrogen antiporter